MDPNIDLDTLLDQMLRRKVVRWNHEEEHDQLFNEYFSKKSCIRRDFVLKKVSDAFNNHHEYFQTRVDVARRKEKAYHRCKNALLLFIYWLTAHSLTMYVTFHSLYALGMNCLVVWKDQFYQGDHANPIIILEVVTSQDFVLNASNVFNEVLSERVSAMQYIVNETQYDMKYYLADDIYSDFAI
ncbi:hypothetical protein GmHk_18G050704 [Glycine max]|nr:hypothetical protein GmHk_18G050704 [Glycine max]